MQLASAKEVEQFIIESRSQSEAMRDQLARKAALGHCYFVGKHWITDRWLGRDWVNFKDASSIGKRRDPDRMARNVMDRYLVKISAASFPRHIEAEVESDWRDFGAKGAFAGQVNEDILGVVLNKSGLHTASRNANFRRCLSGLHAIGLELRSRSGGDEPAVELRAFDAPAHRFSLDPGNGSFDLADHERVIYSDVWTASKIRRVLGTKLDESKLATFGQLTPTEQAGYFHSEGRAFSGYRQHSKSPAAIVHFVYVKGDYTRFDRMMVMIEAKDDGDTTMRMVDEDDSNPFGGNGMPFAFLSGHISGDGEPPLSDFDLLKQHQDGMNLAYTQLMRLMRKHAGNQWLVDKQAFKHLSGDDEARRQFTNEAWGIILYDSRGAKRANPPTPMQLPSPPNFFGEIVGDGERSVQDSSFRPAGSFGEYKTHTTNDVFARAQDSADDVFGQRVVQDVEAYRHIAEVALGTTIGLVKSHSLCTVRLLRHSGFGDDEFTAIVRQNMRMPRGVVSIREGSARHQSPRARQQALDTAMQFQAIDPMDYRMARLIDLDAPLIESDRLARAFARSMVQRIARGEPYQPRPLRPASHLIVISIFESAMLDPKLSPEAAAAIAAAIDAQEQILLQKQSQAAMASDPQSIAAQEPEPTAADAADPMALLGAALGGQV